MMNKFENKIRIECHLNTSVRSDCLSSIDLTAPEDVIAVTEFHKSIPGYIPTPLIKLPELARRGMRILGNPSGDDKRVISGESGAVTLGLVYELLSNARYGDIKDKLHLKNDAKILLFSTEGDTDPEHYRKVVC